ncbi:MAG: D-glycero-beta-D-manno-heptose 1-phosphate adenylyltransferase [Synergistaceae bacterium]|nr:D-glycero-beta-D-manno-heptose 1-phosphate adenylyltransferase [Synergistaceae bacterium]
MPASLNDIKPGKILVAGDIMLDTYYTGDIKRISPEAPVPVFRKEKERSVLGGAANVAANLDAAEQKVYMMSVVGNDDAGSELAERFARMGIDTELIFRLEDRKTTVKTRFLAGNNQQVIRMDVEDSQPISENLCAEMLARLKEKMSAENFSIVLLSDYMKGLLTYDFTQGVIKLANEANIPAFVDVKDPKIEKYSGAFLLKPNLNELRTLTGINAQTDDEIIQAAEFLRVKGNHKYVLATCGPRGMVLAGENESYFIKSTAQEVFDVTGAGDTTIAYLAACMANGFDMHTCVDIANTAAGIQVSKVGTSLVYWREVRSAMSRKAIHVDEKLLTGKALQTFRKTHEEQRVVFTNGCFDILHAGHVKYLREAAKLGEVLVVGLNSDSSVKRLKGESRPINSQNDRAEILCALGFVDYVVIFEEDTPLNLIQVIQPDVLVKGGDYTPDKVVGADFVKSRGGELFLIPFVEGKSTTNIIRKIEAM